MVGHYAHSYAIAAAVALSLVVLAILLRLLVKRAGVNVARFNENFLAKNDQELVNLAMQIGKETDTCKCMALLNSLLERGLIGAEDDALVSHLKHCGNKGVEMRIRRITKLAGLEGHDEGE